MLPRLVGALILCTKYTKVIQRPLTSFTIARIIIWWVFMITNVLTGGEGVRLGCF